MFCMKGMIKPAFKVSSQQLDLQMSKLAFTNFGFFEMQLWVMYKSICHVKQEIMGAQ